MATTICHGLKKSRHTTGLINLKYHSKANPTQPSLIRECASPPLTNCKNDFVGALKSTALQKGYASYYITRPI